MGKKKNKVNAVQKAAEKRQFIIMGSVVAAILAILFFVVG